MVVSNTQAAAVVASVPVADAPQDLVRVGGIAISTPSESSTKTIGTEEIPVVNTTIDTLIVETRDAGTTVCRCVPF